MNYTDGPEDGMPLLKILRKIFHVLTASDPPRWNAKNHIDGMLCCQFWHFPGLQMECFHLQMECLQIWVNGIPSYVRSIPSSLEFSKAAFHRPVRRSVFLHQPSTFLVVMHAYFPHVRQIECRGLVLYYMCLHAHWTALWGWKPAIDFYESYFNTF